VLIVIRPSYFYAIALLIFSCVGCNKPDRDPSQNLTESAAPRSNAQHRVIGTPGASTAVAIKDEIVTNRANPGTNGGESRFTLYSANCGTTGATGLTDSEGDTSAGGMASAVKFQGDVSAARAPGQVIKEEF
jgi:hypothetical protein